MKKQEKEVAEYVIRLKPEEKITAICVHNEDIYYATGGQEIYICKPNTKKNIKNTFSLFGALILDLSRLPMRQVSFTCDCGAKLSATVWKDIDFDLTCKCKRHYKESFGKILMYHDGVFTFWEGKIEEKDV